MRGNVARSAGKIRDRDFWGTENRSVNTAALLASYLLEQEPASTSTGLRFYVNFYRSGPDPPFRLAIFGRSIGNGPPSPKFQCQETNMNCPACSQPLSERGAFCKFCGTQARCLKCREILELQALACVECGAKLGESSDGNGTTAHATLEPLASNRNRVSTRTRIVVDLNWISLTEPLKVWEE